MAGLLLGGLAMLWGELLEISFGSWLATQNDTKPTQPSQPLNQSISQPTNQQQNQPTNQPTSNTTNQPSSQPKKQPNSQLIGW
jgi:hypothetical protein